MPIERRPKSVFILAAVMVAIASFFGCNTLSSLDSRADNTLETNDLIEVADTVALETSDVILPASEGRIAYYSFEEGGGDVIHDQSGVDLPADLFIATPSDVVWQSKGLQIVNSTTISAIANKLYDRIAAPGTGTQIFTVEVWSRSAETQQGEFDLRILAYSFDTTKHNFSLVQNKPNLNFRVRTTNTDDAGFNEGQIPTFVGGAMTTGLYHHVVTWDPADSSLEYYQNGQKVGDTAVVGGTLRWDTGALLVLGNETTGDRPWLGTVYEVAIYDRGMSGAEAVDRYNAGVSAGIGQ